MKRCLGVPKAKQKAVLLVLLSETPKPKCQTGLYSSWVLYLVHLVKLLFGLFREKWKERCKYTCKYTVYCAVNI